MHTCSTRTLAACVLAVGFSHASAETLNGVPVEVLVRSVVTVSNGSVTFLRIRPPVFQALPPPPPPTPEAPLSAEAQAALAAEESKTDVYLSVTATVYIHADGRAAATELTWGEGDQTYRAWSTADFRLLTQIGGIETATHRFGWFPIVSEIPLAEFSPEQSPAGLALLPANAPANALPEYYLEATETDVALAPVLDAFDWLHAHYYLNRVELAADLVRREAEAAEQARRAAEAAALPRHEKIFFWKIE